MKRILICTDAWKPQVNGVVRTIETTISHLTNRNYEVNVIHPGLFKTKRCPFYPEIRLSYSIPKSFLELAVRNNNAIHLATEGPIGVAFRNYCVKHQIPFTTAYHTNFPYTLKTFAYIPEWMTYIFMRWFHKPSATLMVATETLRKTLQSKKFENNIQLWGRGVDTNLFKPTEKSPRINGPTAVYVGRVSAEKNIEDFLKIKDIRKIVVGDGPDKEKLQNKYPDAIFTGYFEGRALVSAFNTADVFVFPSRAETFGLVVIEALACGVPVAAYPAPGPIDIVTAPELGCLHDDLDFAVQQCLLHGDPVKCREHALKYSWESCTDQFLNNLKWIEK